LAAVAFWFIVQAGRAGVSTWWGSACAALALIVCALQFTALPELVTIAGVAFALWLLSRWEQGGSPRSLWVLVGIVVLWSNLDPRAFIGVVLLALYALGGAADRFLGRSEAADPARTRTLALAGGASVAALLVNPFLWQSPLAPLSLYAGEYPAWRMYHEFPTSVKQLEAFRLLDATYWEAFQASGVVRLVTIAGLLLGVAALVAMGLNRQRLRVAHVLVFAGFTGLALAGSHELAVASLVWAVLANLNAQEWYQHTFRQTYSVDFSERLFSTGGRFVSVVGMLAIAWLAISGELAGGEGNRIGFGLRQPLAAEIAGLRQDLADIPAEHRIFNSTPEQGDVMIWIDRAPFIDSRLALYSGKGERDLLSRHARAVQALRPRNPALPHSGDRKLWRDAFVEYGVDCVLVPLSGRSPNYGFYLELLGTTDFRLTDLGSAAAILYWATSPEEQARTHATQQPANFLTAAFRPESVPEVPERYDLAQPRGWYERWFNLPKPRRSTALQQARHYDFHVQVSLQQIVSGQVPYPDQSAAVAHLAIRHAHLELGSNPQSAVAYRILGHAYELLEGIEGTINALGGGTRWAERRFLQAVNAYAQALTIEPDDWQTWRRMRDAYLRHGKYDLALQAHRRMSQTLPAPADLDATGQRALAQERRNIKQVSTELEGLVRTVNSQIEQSRGEDQDGGLPIRIAYQSGCTLRALELFTDADAAEPVRDPQFRLVQARLLLEAGRAEEASQILGELESVLQQQRGLQWRGTAAMAALIRGDFLHAASLWNEEAREVDETTSEAVFATLPLAVPPALYFRVPAEPAWTWPVDQLGALQLACFKFPAQRSVAHFNSAMTYLEIGQHEQANQQFQQLLEADPDSTFRPLVRMYYFHASGEKEPIDDSYSWDRIPVLPGIFAEDTETPVEAPQPVVPE
jgi:tetratricopeptide (TPR) repeat protein